MQYCNKNNLAVTPQGGNTGLVGGATPLHTEIILSLTKLDKVVSFDSDTGVLSAEAGCILETLNKHVEKFGFCMPYDLGAKGSCMIGGNISTNAGGLRMVRYGSIQGAVLGLEVVLADGRVVEFGSTLRKDNTGYHLKHLFIGAEGTLGIVTRVDILCPRQSPVKQLALIACTSFDGVLTCLSTAKYFLQEIIR